MYNVGGYARSSILVVIVIDFVTVLVAPEAAWAAGHSSPRGDPRLGKESESILFF